MSPEAAPSLDRSDTGRWELAADSPVEALQLAFMVYIQQAGLVTLTHFLLVNLSMVKSQFNSV